MSTSFRTVLVFLGLLALVAGLSVFYNGWIKRQAGDTPTPPRAFGGADPVADPALVPSLREGVEALRADRLDEAFQRLSAIPEDDPGHVVALQYLAEIHRRRGEFEDSLERSLEVVQKQPDRAEAQLGAAAAHYRLGNYAEAERSALLAIELDPQHASARYNVALFRTAAGDLPQAIRSYDRAIAVDLEQRHLLAALADLEQLSARDKTAAVPHYILAYFANRLDNVSVETEELEHFLQLSPAGPASDLARKKLADIEERRGSTK